MSAWSTSRAKPRIDAGIRFGPGKWPGLEAVHLFDDWVTPTASPALIERLGRPTLATLGEFPLLGAPGGRWSEWFARFGGTPPERFVAIFDDSENLHRAAVEGMGIVLGRMTLARPLIEAGRLVDAVRRAAQGRVRALPGVSRRARATTRGLAVFRDWLLEEAQAYEAAMRCRRVACARPAQAGAARQPARKAPRTAPWP